MQDLLTQKYISFLNKADERICCMDLDKSYLVDNPVDIMDRYLLKVHLNDIYEQALNKIVERFSPMFRDKSHISILNIVTYYFKACQVLNMPYDDSSWFEFEPIYILMKYPDRNVETAKAKMEKALREFDTTLAQEAEAEELLEHDMIVANPMDEKEYQEYYNQMIFQNDENDNDLLGWNDYLEDIKQDGTLPADLQ